VRLGSGVFCAKMGRTFALVDQELGGWSMSQRNEIECRLNSDTV
jgi:hypothetical protein